MSEQPDPVPDRKILHRYTDPLSLIWIDAARRLGMRVERSNVTFASWDGAGTLTFACDDALDADDSLAQLIFHEICHALVAGPVKRGQVDWALDNTSDVDVVYEHACHRVQAALAQRYGLRDFFAVTTEWRPYWDALPKDPLAPGKDPALPIARRALAEADSEPFAEPLTQALSDSARIVAIARRAAPEDSLFRLSRELHPSGFGMHRDPERRCADCAWSKPSGTRLRCHYAERNGRDKLRLTLAAAACEMWEERLTEESCKPCGACCREGFDRVEVGPRELLRKVRPELVQEDHFGVFVPRPDGRCVALQGDGQSASYRCSVYSERPRACAGFEIGGSACLSARRRVGLSC